MADWIEYRKALRDHVKVHRLAKLMEIPYPYALGLVSCLWLWAVDNATHGDLSSFTDEEIAYAAKLDGPVNGFRKHLMAVRFLDSSGRLHDWDKHGTRVLRTANERVKKARAAKHKEAKRK